MKKQKHDDRELRDKRRKQILRRIQEEEWEEQWQVWKDGGRVVSEDQEEELEER